MMVILGQVGQVLKIKYILLNEQISLLEIGCQQMLMMKILVLQQQVH
jgi:hypothetical protein